MQADFAAKYQMLATDAQQAQTIYTQISASAAKSQLQRQKNAADMQTKIFEVTQDVTVHRAKTSDKAAQAMDAYLRG